MAHTPSRSLLPCEQTAHSRCCCSRRTRGSGALLVAMHGSHGTSTDPCASPTNAALACLLPLLLPSQASAVQLAVSLPCCLAGRLPQQDPLQAAGEWPHPVDITRGNIPRVRHRARRTVQAVAVLLGRRRDGAPSTGPPGPLGCAAASLATHAAGVTRSMASPLDRCVGGVAYGDGDSTIGDEAWEG